GGGVVRHDAIVDVHGEQRHDDRKDVDQQGRQERVAVEAAILENRRPEPVAAALGGALRRPGIEAELRLDKADQAGILGLQVVPGYLAGDAGLGVLNKIVVVMDLEQQAGPAPFQDEYGRQQSLT